MRLVSEEIAHEVKEEKRVADDIPARQAPRLLREAKCPFQAEPLNVARRPFELAGDNIQAPAYTDRNWNIHWPNVILNKKLLKRSAKRDEEDGRLILLYFREDLAEDFGIRLKALWWAADSSHPQPGKPFCQNRSRPFGRTRISSQEKHLQGQTRRTSAEIGYQVHTWNPGGLSPAEPFASNHNRNAVRADVIRAPDAVSKILSLLGQHIKLSVRCDHMLRHIAKRMPDQALRQLLRGQQGDFDWPNGDHAKQRIWPHPLYQFDSASRRIPANRFNPRLGNKFCT